MQSSSCTQMDPQKWMDSAAKKLSESKPDNEEEATVTQAITEPPKHAGWAPKVDNNMDFWANNKDSSNTTAQDNNEPDLELDELTEVKRAELIWASSGAKYEWQDEFGEIGPPNSSLEKEIFNDEFISRSGNNLDKYSFKTKIHGPYKIEHISSWDDAGLHPQMRENIRNCQFLKPTPIQSLVIPICLHGYDVVAISQTGSGKTGAYLIPIISRLMGKAKQVCAKKPPSGKTARAEPLILIVCPTRELAVQIFHDARRFTYRSMLRPVVVYGGAPVSRQIDDLGRGCDILIGTPGRLIDFIQRPNVLSLGRIKYTVVDEADELLDEGWEEDFSKIMRGGDMNEDGDRSFMMFSATFPRRIRKLAREYMAEDYLRVDVGRIGSATMNVTQVVRWVDSSQKLRALKDLLNSFEPARTLIFVNSKNVADEVDRFLFHERFPVGVIHSQRPQADREHTMHQFRSGHIQILVATSVSSRGLDIRDVMHVINYDLPSHMHGGIHEYVHRIGRTARIGNTGLATSFFNDRDGDLGPELVRTLMECHQTVPDFLEQYAPPEDEQLFESDATDSSLDEENEQAEDDEEENESQADAGNYPEDLAGSFQADKGFKPDDEY